MNINHLLDSLVASKLSVAIVSSAYLFALIEATHVIAITIVYSTIILVDCRLLGLASKHVAFTKVASDLLKWTWSAFVLAVITGSLLFITNANTYYHDFYFRSKMALLLMGGVNVILFQVLAARHVHIWDNDSAASRTGRMCVIASLIIWTAVIFCGRWVGFSTQL